MHRNAKNQKGATSIEFVFVFVVFFMLFYGMVSLTFPLLLSATYQELSAEALREAVTLRSTRLEPPSNSTIDPIDFKTQSIQNAVNSVISNSWLPEKWRESCSGYSGYLKQNGTQWSVCISHNNPSSILPPITLFGLNIIKLPDSIQGEAAISFGDGKKS